MEPELSRSKKVIFTLIALLIVGGALELLAYVACKKLIPSRISRRTAFRSPQDYIAAFKKARKQGSASHAGVIRGKQAVDAGTRRMFHAVLGWDYPPGTEYTDAAGVSYHHGPGGERRVCTSFAKNLIATYGDSFTYCSDVPDCETWQTYLGQMVKANILNFGVAGYGTDQAYLKYKVNEAHVSTRIVMLCILPDDINRVVNVFRTFYAPPDRIALTKPRYIRNKGGGFQLLPNPLHRPADIARLSDPAFVEKLGAVDYWYQQDLNRPKLGFPYLLSLWRWRKTLLDRLIFNAGLSSTTGRRPYYPNNLFEQPEALAIMCHIVDLFVGTARSRGATPIIIVVPHRELVSERMKHSVSRVENLVRYLKTKQYRYLDLIEAMARAHPTAEQLNTWYREHATAEGNRVTARLIYQYLQAHGLLQAGGTQARRAR
jgi:hypothetical protein